MNDVESPANNMYEELFIDAEKRGGEFFIPYTPKAKCLKMLSSKKEQMIRNRGLVMLVEWYRFETFRNKGIFEQAKCDELIGIITDFAWKHPKPGFEIGEMFGREGASSEKYGDYASALKFYKASLGFQVSDPRLRYFRINNLGFCLNFFKKFEEAEEFLRAATAMVPERYNAWKNLGVTLEHQKKYEEAAECYMKAIECSRGEPRSVCHFRRLLVRQPALAEKYPDIQDEEESQ